MTYTNKKIIDENVNFSSKKWAQKRIIYSFLKRKLIARMFGFIILTSFIPFNLANGSNFNINDVQDNITRDWEWDLGNGSVVEIETTVLKELKDDSKLVIDVSIRLISSEHETQWESIDIYLKLQDVSLLESVRDEIGPFGTGVELDSNWHNEKPDMNVDYDDAILDKVWPASLNLTFNFSIDPSSTPFNDISVSKEKHIGILEIIPENYTPTSTKNTTISNFIMVIFLLSFLLIVVIRAKKEVYK